MGTDIFPLESATGFAFRLRLASPVEFRIAGLSPAAGWLAIPAVLHTPCPEHAPEYCVPGCGGGICFSDSIVPNLGLRDGLPLSRGKTRSGCLVASVDDKAAPRAGRHREMTLALGDLDGGSYPCHAMLDNRQNCLNRTDLRCRFAFASRVPE